MNPDQHCEILRVAASPNPAVDPVRFALWTLRDEAALRAPVISTFGVINCTFLRLGYYLGMHISTGTVVGGKIVVEGLSLPEGAVVTVLTPEDDKIVKLPPELQKELIAAIDEADQEVGGGGPEFIESLKRYG